MPSSGADGIDETELLPRLPFNKVSRLLDDWEQFKDEYEAAGAQCEAAGIVFGDWSATYFEAAKSTLATYYTPEEWELVFPDRFLPVPAAISDDYRSLAERIDQWIAGEQQAGTAWPDSTVGNSAG